MFPKSTFGWAPNVPTGSTGNIRLSCIAPCPIISFITTTLSAAPGLPHIIVVFNSPSEEPNSPIWTPSSSVPVNTITAPSITLVIPEPNSPSSLVAIGCISNTASL